MAKMRGVDAKLSRLRTVRDMPASPALIAELRGALADSSNLVAMEAAQIVGACLLADLAADLAAAFDRFMIEPEVSDKQCRAKTAIVETLSKLDYQGEDLFLRGIHHVQMEGVWGGTKDSAAHLRGNSAFALVRINHPGVLNLLADLLADSENVARLAAVQALGHSGRVAAIPLLRFKARSGDEDASVTAECLTALMTMAGAESLPFVSEFLHGHDGALQEGAAFALAESRLPEALPILMDFWPEARRGALQESIALAISLLRLPSAMDFLIDVLAGESREAALAALSALAIHRHNEPLRARIAVAVAKRGETALQMRFDQKFTV
jgi:HEAT repeat protein